MKIKTIVYTSGQYSQVVNVTGSENIIDAQEVFLDSGQLSYILLTYDDGSFDRIYYPDKVTFET